MNQLSLPMRRTGLLIARLQAWLHEAMRRRRRLADARAAAAALAQLDARTLRDIGLDRSEVGSAAWELSRLGATERRIRP